MSVNTHMKKIDQQKEKRICTGTRMKEEQGKNQFLLRT